VLSLQYFAALKLPTTLLMARSRGPAAASRQATVRMLLLALALLAALAAIGAQAAVKTGEWGGMGAV
jgi:hypothetical protein